MPLELNLTASMEDYLEAIFIIEKRKRVVRVRDIAKYLKVKMPSVSGALKGLGKKKLVNHESYEYVELTSQGRKIAQEVTRKHEILYRFFAEILGLDEKIAQTEACQMEHAIGKEALSRIVKFIEFVDACPQGGPMCLKQFRNAVETGDFDFVCPYYGEPESEKVRKPESRNPQSQIPNRDTHHVPRITKEEDQKKMNEKSLDQLKPGMKGTITKVKGQGKLHRRILDMGVVRGATVEVKKVAPLGDPIDIVVKGYHLSLRKSEATNIFVEVE